MRWNKACIRHSPYLCAELHPVSTSKPGSLPAVIAGAMLSARLPHAVLRMALAAVLLAVGAKLAWTIQR